MRITANDVYLDTLCLLIYSTDEVSRALAEEILKVFEEDVKVNPIVDNPETRFWLGIIQDIVESKIDTSKDAEVSSMMAKYRENPLAKVNPVLIETLEEVFEGRKDVGNTRIDAYKRNISNWLIFFRTEKALKTASKVLSRFPNVLNFERQTKILDEVYEYAKEAVRAHEEAIAVDVDQIDFVDFTSRASIKKIMDVNRTRKASNIIKFGLQGLNRMLDEHLKGVKPGEFGCLISPSHHGKTYTLMNMARWTAMYNTPIPKPGLKAAIVFISLENELDENVNTWFRDAYINIFHKRPDGMSEDEMIESVVTEYGKNGFSLLVFRRLANQFGFDEYSSLIKKLQTAGYWIAASFIDYISLMKVDEITGGATRALQLQQLVRNMKTFANHEQIFTMTAMQIDREGSRQLNGGNTYIVKKFNSSNLADCSYAYHEFDLVIFQALEDVANQGRYLTMKIDKHRYTVINPDYKFCAWRFGALGILDDVNGVDTSVQDIYDDSFTPDESASEESVDLFPTPPGTAGKQERQDEIMISVNPDPGKGPVAEAKLGSIGVPRVLPDKQKLISLEDANALVDMVTPTVAKPNAGSLRMPV